MKEGSVKTVTPDSVCGWNMSIAQLFGSGPKWAITCGECKVSFKKRMPIVSNPGIVCPHCGTVNVIPVEVGCE